MRTQQKAEDHREDHSVPVEHHLQDPTHFGDMALVLDQSQMPHNLEHGFSIGEFPYDGHDAELGTPPDGPPILNNNDQSIMSSFFSDPNGITSGLVPFDTGVPHDHGAANGSFGYDFASAMSHSANAGPSHGSLHNGLNGNDIPFGHTDNWNQPQSQRHLNADDMSAASTIHNLKSPTPTPNYSNIRLANGISASWGNFAMPTPIPNLHMSSHIPNVPGQPQLRAVPTQTRHHSFTYPSQPIFTPSQMYMPPTEAASQARGRLSSYGDAAQWPGFRQDQPEHVQGVSFGTDTSFTGGRYQSNHAHHEDKGGNLLGVPMADRAASRPQAYRTMSDQKQNGAQGQGATAPPANGSTAAQWGGMRKQTEGEFVEPQRKRRQSQIEGEAEGDYPADDDDASLKRRKSNSGMVAGLPPSPEGDASNKRKKKMRETLTDAEKRKHHIMSEKKRRELIQSGYTELQNMVPCLVAGKSGLSRSEVLQEIASYLETLKVGNLQLNSELQSFGLDTSPTNVPSTAPPAAPVIKTEERSTHATFAT